jgi:stage IV sporulation protein B
MFYYKFYREFKTSKSKSYLRYVLFYVSLIFITSFCSKNILANNDISNENKNKDVAVNFVNLNKDILGVPFKNDKNIEVVPCGVTIGVKINTEGVMVLGTGKIKTETGECELADDLKSGDLIISANGKLLDSKEDLIDSIEKNNDLNLKVKRDEKICNVNIKPIKSLDDGKNKIGVWVRDGTQGIGTLTYYNPNNNKFGALGHGITDVDTKKILEVKDGEIEKINNISVVKGECGSPGEIVGDVSDGEGIGEIKINNFYGLYGTINLDKIESVSSEKISIGLKNEVHEGPAIIKSDIENGEVKDYKIYIESVNDFGGDDSRSMTIKIIDDDLLNKTNGIIQGMSGCPIIQDGKLIGAVTHVCVRNPNRGYGIFIENMLKQENILCG